MFLHTGKSSPIYLTYWSGTVTSNTFLISFEALSLIFFTLGSPPMMGFSLITVLICHTITTYPSNDLFVCIFNSSVALFSRQFRGKGSYKDLHLLWFMIVFSRYLWPYASEVSEKLFASKMYSLVFLQFTFLKINWRNTRGWRRQVSVSGTCLFSKILEENIRTCKNNTWAFY